VEIALLPFPSGVDTSGADGLMLLATASNVEVQHVFATEDQELWRQLLANINNGTLDAAMLGRLGDLAAASSTGTGAAQKIDDTLVLNRFNALFSQANSFPQASIMISRQGDPSELFNLRAAIATKIVNDLTSSTQAPTTQTYPSQFPVTDADSILFLLVSLQIP
jgi:hypothetical protein